MITLGVISVESKPMENYSNEFPQQQSNWDSQKTGYEYPQPMVPFETSTGIPEGYYLRKICQSWHDSELLNMIPLIPFSLRFSQL